MKTHKIVLFVLLIALVLAVVAFFAHVHSEMSTQNNYIVPEYHAGYIDVITDLAPDIDLTNPLYQSSVRDFMQGDNIAVYDSQGIPLSDAHPDYTFIPHFTQTVVIALDRGVTDENIDSFSDLSSTALPINFDFGGSVAGNMWEYPKTHQIVVAMANALYGGYDIDAVAEDFEKIDSEGRFFTDDMSQPVIVTTDSEAVKLKKAGRDIEIIIPNDGTLSFDFGALVYNDSISFGAELQDMLINQGYRLPDGRCDEAYYPSPAQYENAQYVSDNDEYNSATTRISKTLRRDAFNTRLYGFTNPIETTVFYLFLLFVVVCYLMSIRRRITDKNIRRHIVLGLVLMLYLMTAGLLKSVNGSNAFIETALWYSYYIPILFTPALFVKIAILAGNQRVSKRIEKLYKIYLAMTFIPLLLVFTNNFHNLVFIVENYKSTTFVHGMGYYFVMGWVAVSVVFSYILLVCKSIASPKKTAFIYPAIVSAFLTFYAITRSMKFAPVMEFDTTFTITTMVLLYIEACIQSRLFPTNRGYGIFFRNSNLAMEIRDNNGNTAHKSLVIRHINENFIKRSSNIVGGRFYYFEDHTALNSAEKKLTAVNQKIKNNNEFLLQKSKVQADLAALSAEKSVYDSIDNILLTGTAKIEQIISQIEYSDDKKRLMNIVSIHALVMKRECMYRINVLYQDSQPLPVLMNSFAELRELAGNLGVSITAGCTLSGVLPTNYMLQIYSFFISAFERTIELHCKNILVQIYKQGEHVVFSVLADKPLFDDHDPAIYEKSGVDYTVQVKDWEDSKAYLLTFTYDDANNYGETPLTTAQSGI